MAASSSAALPICVAAQTWQFPKSSRHSFRAYQKTMSCTAIFDNTLVSLPTGMGKTLIASVVLHNYMQLFPTGAVVFMAPTRPLVQQQIKACCVSIGLSAKRDAMMLTGEDPADTRRELWMKRRLIFCTPHILRNDLKSGIVDGRRIVLAIFDEAHHAASEGDPYAEVAKLLRAAGAVFRTLALSATVGADLHAVQRVIDLLHITQVELLTEEDPELIAHTHIKKVAPPPPPPPPPAPALPSSQPHVHDGRHPDRRHLQATSMATTAFAAPPPGGDPRGAQAAEEQGGRGGVAVEPAAARARAVTGPPAG